MDAGTVGVDGREVGAGRVALVVAESVIRKRQADLRHQAVAGDLGDDRGGRDRYRQRIAVDDRLGRAGQAGR